MNKIILISIGILLSAPFKTYSQAVTIFEQANFTGNNKNLPIGNYLLTDFNDKVASLKISAGYVAIIYENADAGGGFGMCIDLLENTADLSIYEFDKKVSYINIFSINRPGYVWVRGSKNSTAFMPGHWERAKSSGEKPDNSVPMMSSFIPSSLIPIAMPTISNTPNLSVRDHRGTTETSRLLITETATEKKYTLFTPSNMLAQDAQLWAKATNDQLGILGSDYDGFENIGSACFERAADAWYIPNNLNIWYPQKQTPSPAAPVDFYKRTIVGKISSRDKPEVQNINEQYNDYDLNVHIKPNPKYMYLISEGHKPEMSKKQFIREMYGGASIRHPWVTTITGCPTNFIGVELEIDAQKETNILISNLINQRLELQMGAYGPWIWDEGHCHQPEIHPAEQMWWKTEINNKKEYTCALFCDASKRFWYRNQMDDGVKIRPWGAPPIKGVYAIAFEVSLGNNVQSNSGERKVFNLQNISLNNVKDYLVTDKVPSNKIYSLNYNDKAIVSFKTNNNLFKVSFEKVGLVPNTNLIRGFIVIETEVGTCLLKNINVVTPFGTTTQTIKIPANADVNKVAEIIEPLAFEKKAGHYIFKITETTVKNNSGMSIDIKQ